MDFMADGKTGMESCIAAQPRYGYGMGVYFLGEIAVTAVNSQAGAGVNGTRGATRGSRCFMLFAASSFGAAFRSLGVISGRIRARTVHFLGYRSLRLQKCVFYHCRMRGNNSRFAGIQCECLTWSAVSATKFERELDSSGMGLKFWYHICFTYSC
jgi:hypothetical protein